MLVTLGEGELEREPRQGAWGAGSVGIFTCQRCIELGTYDLYFLYIYRHTWEYCGFNSRPLQ